MVILRLAFCGAAALLLASCGKIGGASGDCSSADASEVTLGILRDAITEKAGETGEGDPKLSKSKIRASARDLKMSLEDVRTTKNDPNSSKRFCAGTLKIVVPAAVVMDAEQTRKLANLNTVEEMGDNANIERAANSFSADVEFNVQPTDDGSKLFAQLESGEEAVAFFGELIQDHLLKNALIESKAQTDRMQAEQDAAVASANADIEAASLEEAREVNRTMVGSINAIWKALPADARTRLLPLQRAWIKRTAATCKLQAANAAMGGPAMEVARLNCESEAQRVRAEELSNYGSRYIDDGYDSTANAM